MKVTYKIFKTESKYSVDGKEHFSIMKKVTPINSMVSESWERAIKESFDSEENAKKILNSLLTKSHT